MVTRVLFIFTCVLIGFAGCKNEPYEIGTLSITTLANKETGGATATFTYRKSKLWTYVSKTTTATVSSMVFYYVADQVDHITSDSTETSYKRSKFYYDGANVTDSTFLYTTQIQYTETDTLLITLDTLLTATRVVNYNTEDNPQQVTLTAWTDGVPTENRIEFTWENENIIRLFTTTTTGEDVSIKDEIAKYDDQNSVFTKRREYLYTMARKDFFWLSKNNPVVFNDGTGERIYTYGYNKAGYPSNYVTNIGTKYGMKYNEIQ